jgi:hypothetical protein
VVEKDIHSTEDYHYITINYSYCDYGINCCQFNKINPLSYSMA